LLPNFVSSLNLPMKKYQVKLTILGLRNLESSGIFPVKKAFIKFGTGALKSMGDNV
jgi:hypothetical protein